MISFKPLQTSEIDIAIKMMQDFYAIDNYPIDIEVTEKLFQEFIENENLGKAYLICQSDEGRISEIIGYVILTFVFSFEYKGRMAFLDELYITQTARGKGIGKQTIDFVKQEAEKAKVKMMYLEIENHNKNGQKLYLANDFIFHNRKIMKLKF